MKNEEITKGFDEIRQILRENAQEAKQRAQEAKQRAQEADLRLQRIEQLIDKNAQGLQETRQLIDKNAQGLQETRQLIDKNAQEANLRLQKIEQVMAENAEQLRETDRIVKENAEQLRETDRIIKENAEEMRKTDRKINALTNLFTGQWGKLIEAMIKPGCIELFQDRGINVTESQSRIIKSLDDNRHIEIDILLKNQVEKIAVVIEVKTTLQVDDVRDFIKRFNTFLEFFPEYEGYTIHGGVAGVQIDEGVGEYAYRRGLFVLGLGRSGLVRMLNDDKFEPRVFISP